MKYTNHLNVIVAIIGVIVIAQTLTRTFWNSTPEKKYSLEVPATQPKIQVQAPRPVAGQRRSLVQPSAGLPGTVGAPSSSAVQPSGRSTLGSRSRLLTAPGVQPGPRSGVVGVPSGGTAGAPNVVTIPSSPTATPPSGTGLQGDMSGRSLRGQVPFGGRSTFRSPRGAPTGVNLPPPGGNDAAKRQPDVNAPAPPVRSSMPEQRVQ